MGWLILKNSEAPFKRGIGQREVGWPAENEDGVRLRPLSANDVAAAHALSTEVRWPHRLADWEFAFSLGNGLAAERDGAVVGTALSWRWGTRYATLGMVIVSRRWRGRRIGQRLVQSLIARLGSRTLVLYATANGREIHERLGFAPAGEVRQHQGQAMQAPLVALDRGVRLRPASRSDAQPLAALDNLAPDMARGPLARRLLENRDVVVLDRDRDAEGFAVLRWFGRGQLIGPAIAPDLAGAKAFIARWISLCAGKFIRVDVDAASGLSRWLKQLGLQCAGTPTRMVRGRNPQYCAKSVEYALVRQVLG